MLRNKNNNVSFLVDFGRVLHGSAGAANINIETYFTFGTVTLICRIYLFVNLRNNISGHPESNQGPSDFC